MDGGGTDNVDDTIHWKVQHVAWIDSTYDMLIRNCWLELLPIVFANKVVILEGKAGRGKSLFLLCAVFEILYCAKNRKDSDLVPDVHFPENPRVMYVSRDGVKHLATKSDVLVWNQSAWPENIHYCFSDNVDIADADVGTYLTMAATLGDTTVLKEFRKRSSGFGEPKAVLYMPSLDYEEMQTVFPTYGSELEFMFDVIGGNPRLMRIDPVVENKQFYEVVESALFFVFGEEYTPQRDSEEQTRKQRLGRWAIDIVLMNLQLAMKESSSASTSTDSSFFKEFVVSPNYNRGGEQYSSFFLGLVAGKLQENFDSNVMHTLRSLFGASGMGNAFEYTAHAAFATIGSVWCLKSTGEMELLSLGTRIVKRIRNVDDIENLTEGDYGLPTICNFPIIDAVLLPDTGLQMTISTSHEVSVKSLPSILAKLHIEREQFKVVFVVPDEILPSFTFPSGLEDVKMFVTVPKAKTETAFETLVKNKKRKLK
jgi:hypothetical protein